jgi:inner membrane protein
VENISHAVIGSAIAGLLPPGTHPAVAWGIVVGAEIPDIDIVIRFWRGQLGYLRNHRGPTHGLAVMPVWAAAITLVLGLIWPNAPLAQVFAWTLLGVFSHLLYDFTNDYGTQGLWPFSRRWIAMDLVPLSDVYLLGIIGVGWLLTAFMPAHRQLIFVVVWLVLVAEVGLRFVLRRRAARLVQERFNLPGDEGEAAPSGPGWRNEGVGIHPTLFSLNAWRYVVRAPGEYLVGMVWLRDGRVSEPHRARNNWDKVVQASLQSEIVTAFAGWVRQPRVAVERKEGKYLVRWSEMRYEGGGFSPFMAYAWLDESLKVLDEGLGKQRPEHMDREMLRQRLRQEMGSPES